MNAPPRAMDAMLRELMAAGGPGARGPGAPGAPPDVASMLGAMGPDGPDLDKIARAAGMDPAEMRGHAQRLWKHMDDLAERSPEEYRAFLDKQARAAGVDPAAVRPGAGAPSTPSSTSSPSPSSPSPERAVFLMPRPQTGGDAGVGLIAVWRATTAVDDLAPDPAPDPGAAPDFAGGAAPFRARARVRVEPVALPDPRDEDDDTDTPRVTLGGGPPAAMDATVYDLDAHPSAIARALEDASYHARLMEAATTFAEIAGRVRMDRARGRRCYTHRSDATPRTAAAAAAADARRGGLGAGMSSQLLVEIASMAGGATAAGRTRTVTRGDAPGPGPASGSESASASAAAPLVVELGSSSAPGRGPGVPGPSHETRVTRDANGAPVSVETTFALPSLRSVADARLEVSARYVHVSPGGDETELVVALPVAVDPDTVTAKFHRKERKLVVRAAPAEAAAGPGGVSRGGGGGAGFDTERPRGRLSTGESDERR